jgi:hypothetical protein
MHQGALEPKVRLWLNFFNILMVFYVLESKRRCPGDGWVRALWWQEAGKGGFAEDRGLKRDGCHFFFDFLTFFAFH